MLKKVNYPKYIAELYEMVKNKTIINIIKELPRDTLLDLMMLFPNITRQKLENLNLNEEIITKTF